MYIYKPRMASLVSAFVQSDQGFVVCLVNTIKGSIFLKNRHFFIQERLNKLICSINMIIKYDIWHFSKYLVFELDQK